MMGDTGTTVLLLFPADLFAVRVRLLSGDHRTHIIIICRQGSYRHKRHITTCSVHFCYSMQLLFSVSQVILISFSSVYIIGESKPLTRSTMYYFVVILIVLVHFYQNGNERRSLF